LELLAQKLELTRQQGERLKSKQQALIREASPSKKSSKASEADALSMNATLLAKEQAKLAKLEKERTHLVTKLPSFDRQADLKSKKDLLAVK
jgi:hypothetical protein